jgi:hypothetical protein
VNIGTNYESFLYHFAILAICVCSKRQLAGYYDRGDFEKAKMGYELLVNILKICSIS